MKHQKNTLFTKVLSLFLVLSICLSTPLSAKAATADAKTQTLTSYDTSGVYAQSNDLVITPNANSFVVDFSAEYAYYQSIFPAVGTTDVTISYFDNASKKQTYSLAAGVTTFTFSGLSAGIMYTVDIEPYYTSSSGQQSKGFSYLMYQVAGDNSYSESPIPTFTGDIAAVAPVPTPAPTPTPEPTPAPVPAAVSVATPKVSKAYLENTSTLVAQISSYSANTQGIEYKIYYKNGKNKYVNWKAKSGTSYRTVFYAYDLNKATTYYVQVRAWAYDANYNKVYSKWSAKKYFVSQPSINSAKSKKTLKAHSVTLYWNKVKGAKKYIVYCSSNKNKGYKKVATTKSNHAKITKFKGKTVNFKNSSKYFYVIAVTDKCKSYAYECTSCILHSY